MSTFCCLLLLCAPSQSEAAVISPETPIFADVNGGKARFAEFLPRVLPPTANQASRWGIGPVDSLARFRKACKTARLIRHGMKKEDWRPLVQSLNWLASSEGLDGGCHLFQYFWLTEGRDREVAEIAVYWP